MVLAGHKLKNEVYGLLINKGLLKLDKEVGDGSLLLKHMAYFLLVLQVVYPLLLVNGYLRDLFQSIEIVLEDDKFDCMVFPSANFNIGPAVLDFLFFFRGLV